RRSIKVTLFLKNLFHFLLDILPNGFFYPWSLTFTNGFQMAFIPEGFPLVHPHPNIQSVPSSRFPAGVL
ncbi:hypothetical protein, partial [Clostridium sp. MCC353]|uniref:hypothetical protein n=1 Tax=Clostridium sp. MCC353 TaxID=2592646 RepID=UPI001C024DFB